MLLIFRLTPSRCLSGRRSWYRESGPEGLQPRKTPDVKRLQAIAERWRPYPVGGVLVLVASWNEERNPSPIRTKVQVEKKSCRNTRVADGGCERVDAGAQAPADIPKLDVEKYTLRTGSK
jgi:hypothetical protein